MSSVKTAAVAALLVMAAVPAQAQQRMHRPMRGQQVSQVETALRMREDLKLSGAQVAQLESLRKEIVAQRQKEAVEMIDLRSRIAAGNVPGDEMRKQFEGRREQLEKTATARREQFERILTEEQRAQLARANMNARLSRRDHMRGPRGPQGFRGREGGRFRQEYRRIPR